MTRRGRPANDLVGKVYGKWTVIKRIYDHPLRLHGSWYLCKCECGYEGIIPANGLRHNGSNSCKNCSRKEKSNNYRNSFIGKIFGSLYVIKEVEKPKGRKSGGIYFLCRCECGKEIICISGYIKKYKCHKNKNKNKSYDTRNSEIAKIALLKQYKDGAEQRHFSFQLTDNEFFSLTKQNCFYCGKPPTSVKMVGKNGYIYTGVDRMDSSKGYITENVVPCCKRCNIGKREIHISEFLEWIERTYSFYLTNKKTTDV